MIAFTNVNKWYGDYHALNDINAEVARGEVVVVCGPSGSGKSTLIRTVNRLEEIRSGQLTVDGFDIHAKGNSARDLNRMRSRIGFVFQSFNLFPHLSVLENIAMSPMRVRGVAREDARATATRLPAPVAPSVWWIPEGRVRTAQIVTTRATAAKADHATRQEPVASRLTGPATATP